ncbi:MAG: hypothetical protein AAGD25_05120 [Cyanobacteria bacterium P01_F01_bin.150]
MQIRERSLTDDLVVAIACSDEECDRFVASYGERGDRRLVEWPQEKGAIAKLKLQ